uniref:Uncharacterized protein n=1 Tax=Setaria viridis TaxID=4556 RepID=A0A4U6WF46_SETVI|nr:hypothetical protein SEVIR_1G319800v2 [Setaria viridis]
MANWTDAANGSRADRASGDVSAVSHALRKIKKTTNLKQSTRYTNRNFLLADGGAWRRPLPALADARDTSPALGGVCLRRSGGQCTSQSV